MEAFRQAGPYGLMVRLHPELLKQVEIVVAFGDLLSDGLHPLGLVLAAKLRRHAPRVEGHHLELDAICRGASDPVEVDSGGNASDDDADDEEQ